MNCAYASVYLASTSAFTRGASATIMIPTPRPLTFRDIRVGVNRTAIRSGPNRRGSPNTIKQEREAQEPCDEYSGHQQARVFRSEEQQDPIDGFKEPNKEDRGIKA